MTSIAQFAEALAPDASRIDDRALSSASVMLIVASHAGAAARDAAAVARAWAARHGDRGITRLPHPSLWPFLALPDPPSAPTLFWVPGLHRAFVSRQGAGTRLVTTQSAYLLAAWQQALAAAPGSLLLATADATALGAEAPEARDGRGAWQHVQLLEASVEAPAADLPPDADWHTAPGDSTHAPLALAFAQPDPGARLEACVAALDVARTAPVLLAMASVCMEASDLDAAHRVLTEAAALAPAWAALHFETGKLRLRTEDMEGAAEAFRQAAALLPAFPSAWANLGAALGELDRTGEALTAFEHALAIDPTSVQTINNIGVLRRDLGRLPDSEAAFRQVIALAPQLAMGHYNLGHTLFLQGRYQAALSAYTEGRRRDPDGNPVQTSRLAVCRLATGDAAGALSDLQQCTGPLPRDYRRQLLADTRAILWALFTHRPDLAGWSTVTGWLDGELARLDRA